MQRLRRWAAQLASVQDALGDEALNVLRIAECDADRRGAGARQEQNADQRSERDAFT
jgi:hypothetical protein